MNVRVFRKSPVSQQLVPASAYAQRDMNDAGGLESTEEAKVALATPRAFLTHLFCSPNSRVFHISMNSR